MLKLKGQKLLVITPHPDDEVIGCGGLIAKAKEEKAKVFVLFLANGDSKDFSKARKSTGNERMKEIEKVAKFLKYDDFSVAFGGNSHHLKLDKVARLDLINAIERSCAVSIEKIRPTMVLFPQFDSYSQDHQAAAAATFAACRPSNGELKFQPSFVASYEIPADQWSLTKVPSPNFFIKLQSIHINKKIAALRLYKSQVRKHPNPRSEEALRSLAHIRGAQSDAKLAEAFFCHKFLA